MKVKNIKKFTYSLLRLSVLKFSNPKFRFELLDLYYKKALQVIYEYHLNNKQILFVGLVLQDEKKLSKILKKTRHLAISETLLTKSFLSNEVQSAIKTGPKNKKMAIKLKPDLIIFFNNPVDQNLLNEALRFKIPTIVFSNYNRNSITYFVFNNIKNSNYYGSSLFFLILHSIFKRSVLDPS